MRRRSAPLWAVLFLFLLCVRPELAESVMRRLSKPNQHGHGKPAPKGESAPAALPTTVDVTELEGALGFRPESFSEKMANTHPMQVYQNITFGEKIEMCKSVLEHFNSFKNATSSSPSNAISSKDACAHAHTLKEKAECQNMVNLLQVMSKSTGDMIPTIESLRHVRRTLEKLEAELGEERRRKAFQDKTKTQLIIEIESLVKDVKQCHEGCKQWCNEMILVLLTKLKLCQQRLVICRQDLEKCRQKIALLIIEIQHLKVVIQKMVGAIMWMYNKIIMLLAVIARLKAWMYQVYEKVCSHWLKSIESMHAEMSQWCQAWAPADYSMDFLNIISREARQFEWASFDASFTAQTMSWTIN